MQFAKPGAIMSAPRRYRPHPGQEAAITYLITSLPRGPGIVLRLALVLLCMTGAVQAQVTDTGTYLQRIDADADGRVSEAEYVQWMMYAFDRMDADGDGVLDASELPGGKGRPITREQQRQTLVQRFHKQDANHDGFLDARELAAPPR